jgi:hypothetical protein
MSLAIRLSRQDTSDRFVEISKAVDLECVTQLFDVSTNAFEVDSLAMQRQQTLDILLIHRPPRDCLEDDQVIRLRDHRRTSLMRGDDLRDIRECADEPAAY